MGRGFILLNSVLVISCLFFSFILVRNNGNVFGKNRISDMSIMPKNLRVPALAFEEKSIVLVWDKPDNCLDIVDFNVYMDNKFIGSANANNDRNSPAKPYINKFYANDAEKFHVKILIHCFTVTDLKPNTEYSFTVRSVLKDGSESADSNKITQRTTDVPKIFDITKYGAKGDGEKINTEAIQKAIDECTEGGKVLVPSGVFKTGALFLKSNMTLEIVEGAVLLGSEKAEDYPLNKGYRLYPYSKNDRPPSLINALSPDRHEPGSFQNIRITGKGVIDGNGWNKTTDGFIIDEVSHKLPQYIAGNNKSVMSVGVLAKNQTKKATDAGMNIGLAYGQNRSSLITLRGVRNVYYSGITVINPAFHGIMNLECENIVLNKVIFQTYDANNGDGVEFGNSNQIMVLNCFFDTGDDCVNFASGTGIEATKQKPSQNAWIFNNYFREGHGAVVAGSHTGAWIQKILAEDNVINGTEIALRCKSNLLNGGGAKDIILRDNVIKDIAKQVFIFTIEYIDPNAALDYTPAQIPAQFRDIYVKNITVEKSRGTNASIEIKGNPDKNAYHENLNFENIIFKDANPARIDSLKNSSFKNVKYLKVKGDINPWLIAASEGLTFEGSAPQPKK